MVFDGYIISVARGYYDGSFLKIRFVVSFLKSLSPRPVDMQIILWKYYIGVSNDGKACESPQSRGGRDCRVVVELRYTYTFYSRHSHSAVYILHQAVVLLFSAIVQRYMDVKGVFI